MSTAIIMKIMTAANVPITPMGRKCFSATGTNIWFLTVSVVAASPILMVAASSWCTAWAWPEKSGWFSRVKAPTSNSEIIRPWNPLRQAPRTPAIFCS